MVNNISGHYYVYEYSNYTDENGKRHTKMGRSIGGSIKEVCAGFSDLATCNQELTKEWDYESNGDLPPQDVTVNSNKRVWWKCPKGHKWSATVNHRNQGSGCPYCSGRRAIERETDLQTGNPELAKEWDYEANGDLTPREIVVGSVKKSWWKCSKGHKWEETIANRINGNGCPYCSNKINDRRD